MDRTLFTPSMIETFRQCRRAYWFAFEQGQEKAPNTQVVLKRFLLKAIGEINRGRITAVTQVQKYLGQHWPSDEVSQEEGAKAFLFAYKLLSNYVANPYRPKGAQLVAVNLKVRARVAHVQVYIEDSFDLIFWHPQEKRLEFVDFHLHALKPFDPTWPSTLILVKQFLAEKLKVRWPFEKLSLTFCQVGPTVVRPATFTLDEALYRLHWPEVIKTVEEMKHPDHYAPHETAVCKRCEYLERSADADNLSATHHCDRRISRTA